VAFLDVEEPTPYGLRRRACVDGEAGYVAPYLVPFHEFRHRVHKGVFVIDNPLAAPGLGHCMLVYITEMKL
jgi:hypothetical protein